MGSVGSLLERQDFSPEELRAALAGSRGSRQPDGLLRKGLGQRELFSYLHLPKKDGKTSKRAPRNEPADYATLYYREHPRASDFSKTSLPERGRFDKCRIRPSVFKPVSGTGKGFLSMQSLAAHKGQKLWRSNGSLHTLACHPPLSPGPRASQARAQLLHALSLDEAGPEPEPSLSDSSSGGSFGRSPGTGPSPFSSSLGHINHLGGSLDRASRSPKEAGPLSVLSCLPDPPPPYEFSCSSADEVVAVLPDSCEQLKRDLGEQDGSSPFTQVREPLSLGPILSFGNWGMNQTQDPRLPAHPHGSGDKAVRKGQTSGFCPHVAGTSGHCIGIGWKGWGEAPRRAVCWGRLTSGRHL